VADSQQLHFGLEGKTERERESERERTDLPSTSTTLALKVHPQRRGGACVQSPAQIMPDVKSRACECRSVNS